MALDGRVVEWQTRQT